MSNEEVPRSGIAGTETKGGGVNKGYSEDRGRVIFEAIRLRFVAPEVRGHLFMSST